MKTRILSRIVCLVACMSMSQLASAAILFTGQFDLSNFVLDADGGIGSVDTTLAPAQISLHGHNEDGEGSPDNVVTSYLATVLNDTSLTFHWAYDTFDDDASYDPFGYYLNGSYFQLTDDSLVAQYGSRTVNLVTGDVFGFYTDATDNCCGASVTQIGGDPVGAAAVPEPASVILMAGGLGVLSLLRRRAH